MPRHARWGLFVVAAVALSACTAEPSPPPDTTPPETSATSETARPTGPPPVAAPVDLGALGGHACAVLSGAQQAELGMRVAPTEAGETCVWDQSERAPGSGDQFGYVLGVDLAGDPLAEAYRRGDDRTGAGQDYTWALFEPRSVRELPAVVRSLVDPAGQCEVVVGTGNGQGISVKGVVAPTDPDLCDRLVSAAELVVDAARG